MSTDKIMNINIDNVTIDKWRILQCYGIICKSQTIVKLKQIKCQLNYSNSCHYLLKTTELKKAGIS